MILKFDAENTYEAVEGYGNCHRCHEFTLLDEHHRVRRKNDPEGKYSIRLCRMCHRWVHEHVEMAYNEGYLISYYDTIEYKEKYGKVDN